MGFDPEKAFDNVYPFVKLPFLHPNTPEDNITFGFPEDVKLWRVFGQLFDTKLSEG